VTKVNEQKDAKDKKDEEYAAEFMPRTMSFSREATERADDGLNFFRGIIFGSLLAIPLWALTIWAIARLVA